MKKNQQIAVLTLRLLLGVIFFFQGLGKVFKFGLENVYKNFFQSSYADILPDFLLLFTAYYTSLVELIGGFLLIIGFKRDYSLYTLASVLVIVSIGHGLKDPIWDLSHVMFRTILLVSLLLLPKTWDTISVDYFINSKQKKTNMSYLETTHDVYKEAALTPDVGLCCTTNPIWELPGIKNPKNYAGNELWLWFNSTCQRFNQ